MDQTGFAFPKSKRIEDPELLEVVRRLPCMGCGVRGPNDAHHITTKGSGGHDIPDNLIPLCREHHSLWHQKGGSWMAKHFPCVKNWLECAERWDVLKGKPFSIDNFVK